MGFFSVWLYQFPDGGAEVVVQNTAAAPKGFSWRCVKDERPAQERSAARSRRILTRYVRFHGLVELWTLTFADVPSERRDVRRLVELFLRRLSRAVGESVGPYVVVEEYGGSTGRLHLHLGANWARRFGAVEVCLACARPALLAVRSDVPQAGALCVGCLWGHGFVGRPGSFDPDVPSAEIEGSKGLSAYLSKYLAKDLDSGLAEAFGRRRYQVSLGFPPDPPLRFDVESVERAVVDAEALVGRPLEWWRAPGEADGPLTVIGSA